MKNWQWLLLGIVCLSVFAVLALPLFNKKPDDEDTRSFLDPKQKELVSVGDETTYYWNDYDTGEAWLGIPGNMVDGNIANFAYTDVSSYVQLNDENSYSSGGSGTISKVEIRAYAKTASASANDLILRPVFSGITDCAGTYTFQMDSGAGAWSSWFDITSDGNAPSWDWDEINTMDMDVQADLTCAAKKENYVSKIELRVTYTEANNPPTQSNELPTNQSIITDDLPLLNVTCTDAEGNSMNATWLSNSSGSWVQFGNNETSFSNGSIQQTNSNFTDDYNTTYWWSVNLTDGKGGWDNETYHFSMNGYFPYCALYFNGTDYPFGSIADRGSSVFDLPYDIPIEGQVTTSLVDIYCAGFTSTVFNSTDSWNTTATFFIDNMYAHIWHYYDDEQIGVTKGTEFNLSYNISYHSPVAKLENYSYSMNNPETALVSNVDPDSDYLNLSTPFFWDIDESLAEWSSVSYFYRNFTIVNWDSFPHIVSNLSISSFIILNVPEDIWDGTDNSTDTDGDGLSDHMELNTTYGYFTDPFRSDTDNDGINDYWENQAGSDPNNYTETFNMSAKTPVLDLAYWISGGNDATDVLDMSYWISGGNDAISELDMNYWISGGNNAVSELDLSYWLSGGNETPAQIELVMTYWLSGGNVSDNVLDMSYWISGGNETPREYELDLSYWLSGGNTSTDILDLTYWISGGNDAISELDMNYWISGGNNAVSELDLSYWLSGGNETPAQIELVMTYWLSGGNVSDNVLDMSYWISGGNETPREYELDLSYWLSGGNTSTDILDLTYWISGGNDATDVLDMLYWISGGNETPAQLELVMTYWLSGGNVTNDVLDLTYWISGGNDALTIVDMSYWISGGNDAVSELDLSYWISGGNVTNDVLDLTYWISGGNDAADVLDLVYWVSGGNETSAPIELDLTYWISGGNTSTNILDLSYWISGGNVTNDVLDLTYWISGGNDAADVLDLSYWISGGNDAANSLDLTYWIFGGNETPTPPEFELDLSYWISGGNETIGGYVADLVYWISGGNETLPPLSLSDEYPVNGSVIYSVQPTLYFTLNSPLSNMSYELFIGNTANTTNFLVDSATDLENGTYHYANFYNASEYDTTYYWRVHYNDSSGHANETFSFTIEAAESDPSYIATGTIAIIGVLAMAYILWRKQKKGPETEDQKIYDQFFERKI